MENLPALLCRGHDSANGSIDAVHLCRGAAQEGGARVDDGLAAAAAGQGIVWADADRMQGNLPEAPLRDWRPVCACTGLRDDLLCNKARQLQR